MAEKRFTIVVTGSDGSFHYWDKFTDERITSALELENKLNELSDENEQLKHELHTLTGLYAFDKLGKGVKASDDSIIVPRKDLIKLDYGDVE